MQHNMQTITICDNDIDQDLSILKKISKFTPQQINNLSCIIFYLKNYNPYVLFFKNPIYEFKIDYYKTGTFAGKGFFEYCKVQYDKDNNNYKIYGYYAYKGKFHPTQPTREGKFDIIELDCLFRGFNYFKGPKFTEGPKKGLRDTWILNTKNVYHPSD